MERELGRGPSRAVLRVRILFWDEEPQRNVKQKNGMSRLIPQDSGSPEETELMGRGQEAGRPCRKTVEIVGPKLGQWGHRWKAGGGAKRRWPPINHRLRLGEEGVGEGDSCGAN